MRTIQLTSADSGSHWHFNAEAIDIVKPTYHAPDPQSDRPATIVLRSGREFRIMETVSEVLSKIEQARIDDMPAL